VQGEKMSNSNFDNNLVNSILTVKASEQSESEVLKDLNLPEGKTIAELLDDKKNIARQENQDHQEEKTINSSEEDQIHP
jgi:hypothetical protein